MKNILIINFLFFINLIAFSQTVPPNNFISIGNKDTIHIRQNANNIDTTDISNNFSSQYRTKLGNQEITIFSNQAKGKLTIEINDFNNQLSGSIIVSDTQNNVIYQDSSITGTNTIDFSDISIGQYSMSLIINGMGKDWVIIRE